MTTLHFPGAILHLSESKAVCPACQVPQPIEILEPKWIKAKGFSMRHKCRCGEWMHITGDTYGDFVAYK